MKQNTIIHILLGVAVLPAIALLYVLLAHHNQSGLSPARWVLFGVIALVLILAAFSPSLVRRFRGLPPPQPLSASDIRFCVFVAVAGSALAFFGIFLGMLWMMVLGIMLAPLCFVFRPRMQRDNQKS